MVYSRYLIFVLILCSQTVFGQNDEKKNSLGLSFNPNYLYRTIWATGPEHKSIVDNASDNDFGFIGFSIGIKYSRQISHKINIESGLLISQRGVGSILHTDLVFDSIGDPKGNLRKLQTRVVRHYIDFPLLFQYRFVDKEKVSYYLKTGISFNLLINRTTYYTRYFESGFYESGEHFIGFNDRKHYNFKTVHVTYILSLGFEYKFRESLSFVIEPIVMYSILPVDKSDWMDYRFLEMGLTLGIYYHF